MTMIKTISLYVIFLISLLFYSDLSRYILNNGKSIILKLIYYIITITFPLIFTIECLV